MKSSKKLLKEAGLSISEVSSLYAGGINTPSFEEVKKLFPPTGKISSHVSSTHENYEYECDGMNIEYEIWHEWNGSVIKRCMLDRNGTRAALGKHKFFYNWRGSSVLESTKLISCDIIESINKAKDAELEKARLARQRKIETPIDVVRVTLLDLGYEPKLQDGKLREYIFGSTHIGFLIKEPYGVEVALGHYYGGSGGAYYEKIATLNIADPDFKDSVSAIMKRALNLINYIASGTE